VVVQAQGDRAGAAQGWLEVEPRAAGQPQLAVREGDVQRVFLRLERRAAREVRAVAAAQRSREPGVPLAEVVQLHADETPLPLLFVQLAKDLALLLLRRLQRHEPAESHLILRVRLDEI